MGFLACVAGAALSGCGDPLVSGVFRGNSAVAHHTGGGVSPSQSDPNASTGSTGSTTSTPSAPVTCPTYGYGTPMTLVGTAGGVQAPYDLKLTRSDAPVLAWNYSAVAHVAQWNGSAWVGWANSDTTGLGVANSGVVLVLDANDNPSVAWGAYASGGFTFTSNIQAVLKRWNGSSWAGADGAANGYANTFDTLGFLDIPAIALGMYAGQPTLAWVQGDPTGSPNTQVALSYFDGVQWSPTYTQPVISMLNAAPTSVSLVNDHAGRLIVAWSTVNAMVGIFDQNTIVPVGTLEGSNYYRVSSQFAQVNEPVTAAQNANGQLLLAWTDASNANGPFVAFNMTGSVIWENQANSESGISPNQPAHHVSMASDAVGNPWLAWEDGAGHIVMRYFNGTAWVESGGSALGTGVSGSVTATWPKLLFTSKNQAILSWVENGNTVRVCQWKP